jgi:predicted dienelactone hydrolase
MILGLALLLGGCSNPDEAPAAPKTVAERGPYNVGQWLSTVRYQPGGVGSERELRLVVWYPTKQSDGPMRLYGSSILDAEPIAEKQFPAMVYSHGTSSFAESAYHLMEHFASHGFVAAAPDHTGDTTADYNEERTTDMYLVRPQDISAVIDHLQALPDTSPLAGRIGSELLLTGHSYGGYNAMATSGARFDEQAINACEDDPSGTFCSTMTADKAARFKKGFLDDRIQAVIPMAAGNSQQLGPAGVADITIPVMLMTAGRDSSNSNEAHGNSYWDALSNPESVRVDLPDGGHHSYIMTCELSPVIANINGGGCGDPFVDINRALTITNTYALAFGRLHLFGDDSMRPVLKGETLAVEEATLSYKTQ